MQPIQNENSVVSINEDGVFVVKWKDNTKLEKEDLEQVVNQYDEMSDGALWKVLHIFPLGTNVSSQARSYAEKREKPAKAEAFVIESRFQRGMFRFYQKFRSVDYPMRGFSSEEDAKTWLATFE